MAALLRADGTAEPLDVSPETGFTLDQLHDLVGGYIEFVYLDRSTPEWHVLIADEDGLGKEKPLNRLASILAGQPIVGDVVMAYVQHPGTDAERIL